MYLTRQRVSIATTGTTSSVDYSDGPVNGLVYAITYTANANVIPSTGTIAVSGERNGVTYLTLAATTAGWTKYPRVAACDTTGVNLANGSTGAGIYPELMPVIGERFVVTLAGATGTTSAGTVDVFVRGA